MNQPDKKLRVIEYSDGTDRWFVSAGEYDGNSDIQNTAPSEAEFLDGRYDNEQLKPVLGCLVDRDQVDGVISRNSEGILQRTGGRIAVPLEPLADYSKIAKELITKGTHKGMRLPEIPFVELDNLDALYEITGATKRLELITRDQLEHLLQMHKRKAMMSPDGYVPGNNLVPFGQGLSNQNGGGGAIQIHNHYGGGSSVEHSNGHTAGIGPDQLVNVLREIVLSVRPQNGIAGIETSDKTHFPKLHGNRVESIRQDIARRGGTSRGKENTKGNKIVYGVAASILAVTAATGVSAMLGVPASQSILNSLRGPDDNSDDKTSALTLKEQQKLKVDKDKAERANHFVFNGHALTNVKLGTRLKVQHKLPYAIHYASDGKNPGNWWPANTGDPKDQNYNGYTIGINRHMKFGLNLASGSAVEVQPKPGESNVSLVTIHLENTGIGANLPPFSDKNKTIEEPKFGRSALWIGKSKLLEQRRLHKGLPTWQQANSINHFISPTHADLQSSPPIVTGPFFKNTKFLAVAAMIHEVSADPVTQQLLNERADAVIRRKVEQQYEAQHKKNPNIEYEFTKSTGTLPSLWKTFLAQQGLKEISTDNDLELRKPGSHIRIKINEPPNTPATITEE